MLGVLLKRQLDEKLSVFKRGKKGADFVGALLTLALAAAVIYVVVTVFSQFAVKYCAIRMNGISDTVSRQFELMSIVYEVVLVIGVISAIGAINYSVFENDDRKILMTLPVKASTVFLSKIISVYIKETFVCLILLLPFNMTFAAVTAQNAYYIATSVLTCFLLPVFTVAIASLFSLPVYFVKRVLKSRYVTLLLILTLVFGLLFWGYAEILEFIKTLITTGEIKFFFSENVMNSIIGVTRWLYPANLFANIVLGRSVGENIGILIAALAVCGGAGTLIVKALFDKAGKTRTAPVAKARRQKRASHRTLPPFVALLKKEFGLVLKTPDYAVQYFALAAIMPLMVYFCLEIGSGLMSGLVMTDGNLELALLLSILFGALTNTFCTTNISRDGTFFYAMKTLPVTGAEVLGAKILFSSIISTLSIAVSAVVISATGYVSFADGAFVFFVAWLLGEAQICFATRCDLNHPRFSTEEDGEVRESNNTVSAIIALGICVALILGGASLYHTVFNTLKSRPADAFTYAFCAAAAVALATAAVVFLFAGLKKKYAALMEGGQ